MTSDVYAVTVSIQLEAQQSDIRIGKALDLIGTAEVLAGIDISDTVQTMLDNTIADLYRLIRRVENERSHTR